MDIPPQLQNENFRFCLVLPKAKKAFEDAWSTTNNYPHNSPVLHTHLNKQGNYGVIGGFGNLLIIDFDNQEFQNKFYPLLPPTFTVKSGRGMMHLYYICEGAKTLHLKIDGTTQADLLAKGTQAIAPGSTHPNGNKYAVERDLPITTIYWTTITNIFSDYIEKKPEKLQLIQRERDSLLDEIKSKVNLRYLLEEYGYDTSKNPTTCRLGHSSKGGQNFSWDANKGVWNCFNCDKAGDIFNLIQFHDNCDFPTAKNKLMEIAGMNPKKEVAENRQQDKAGLLARIQSKDRNISKEDRHALLTEISYFDQCDQDELIEELAKATQKKSKSLQKDLTDIIRERKEKISKEKKLANMNIKGFDDYDYLGEVARFHAQQPFFYDKMGLFWLWEDANKRWVSADDTDMLVVINRALQLGNMTVLSKDKNAFLEAFRQLGRQLRPKDAPPEWIQFKDTVFDIRTKSRFPATPEYYFINPVPWNIGKTSETPIIDKLFHDWVGESYVDSLYEIIAYCCYRGYPIQVAICLIGTGRNGKSKYQGLLQKFIGEDNCVSTSLETLSTNIFEAANLYCKAVAMVGETSQSILENTSVFKRITGEDLISINYKFKNPIQAKNYAKIIIATNSLHPSRDQSEGFFRRWFVIDFPNDFSEGKDILQSIPDQEFENLSNKVIETLPKLLERGSFNMQGTILDRQDKYQLASNPLPLFISGYCLEDKKEELGYWISVSELNKAYNAYLVANRRGKVRPRDFKDFLEELGYFIKDTTKRLPNGDSFKSRVVEHIKLKFSTYEEFLAEVKLHTTKKTAKTAKTDEFEPVQLRGKVSLSSEENNVNSFLLTPKASVFAVSAVNHDEVAINQGGGETDKDYSEAEEIEISPAQEAYRKVKNFIIENDSQDGADLAEMLDKFGAGIQAIIDQMKERGDIHESKPGRYKRY